MVRLSGHVVLAAVVLLAACQSASGQSSEDASGAPLAEQVAEGCRSELETYCNEVTPGEARLLACLYAHQDKLSGRCDYTLYDAAVRLERAISAITYVASECATDIGSQCAEVKMGEGRIAQCLIDHRSELSGTCTKALTDVGLVE